MSYKNAKINNVYVSGLSSPFKLINVMESSDGYINTPNHSHTFYHLNYIFSGKVTVTFKEEKYNLSGGMAFILPPNIPHSVYTDSSYRQFGIDLLANPDDRGLINLIESACENKFISCKIPDFSATFPEMHKKLSNPTAINHLITEHKAEEILLKTVDSLNKEKATAFEENFINAISCIKGIPTLDKICELTGYSRVHTERLAKSYFGCGAIEYINRLKINRICSLLSATDMPISEIAEKEGFYDASHLTVFFKKRMGITPSKYRK